MERCAEMEEYIKSYCYKRKNEKRKLLNDQYGDILERFLTAIDMLVRDAEKMQTLNKQGKVKYLVFQKLLSSGYTGSHEISIAISNAALYLDENMSCTYWKPEAFYHGLEDDMKQVRLILNKKYIRVEEYELMRLERCLLSYDWELLCEFLSRMAVRLVERMKASHLKLENEVQMVESQWEC